MFPNMTQLENIKKLEKSKAIIGVLQLITLKKAITNDLFEYLESFETPEKMAILNCHNVLELEQFKHDSFCQYKLGQMYLVGFKVDKNISLSLKHFNISADMGNEFACDQLGLLYCSGNSIPTDLPKSRDYFQKGVDLGSSLSALSLGCSYFFGEDVKQSYETAMEYYKKSVEPLALNNIAAMYQQGYGIDIDNKKAFEYFMMAANKGYAIAQNAIGDIYEFGPDKNIDLALKYYKMSADNGNENGRLNYYGLFNGVDKSQRFDDVSRVMCSLFPLE